MKYCYINAKLHNIYAFVVKGHKYFIKILYNYIIICKIYLWLIKIVIRFCVHILTFLVYHSECETAKIIKNRFL
jgi:hypothetical protein